MRFIICLFVSIHQCTSPLISSTQYPCLLMRSTTCDQWDFFEIFHKKLCHSFFMEILKKISHYNILHFSKMSNHYFFIEYIWSFVAYIMHGWRTFLWIWKVSYYVETIDHNKFLFSEVKTSSEYCCIFWLPVHPNLKSVLSCPIITGFFLNIIITTLFQRS
jgi:hypothetical protein